MGKVIGGMTLSLDGDGLRLFDHLTDPDMPLEKIRLFESGARTDIWFRIMK